MLDFLNFLFFSYRVLSIILSSPRLHQCSLHEDSLLGSDHYTRFNPLEQFFNTVYTRDFLVQILFTHTRITQEGTLCL